MKPAAFGFILALAAASAARAEEKQPPAPPDPSRLAAVRQRIAELTASLPARPVLSGKGMKTKLGLYYLLGKGESKGMLDLADGGGVPVVKTFSVASGRAHRVVEHNPKAVWIVSVDLDLKMDAGTQSPAEAADECLKRAKKEWKHVPEEWRPRVDFLELTQIMWEPHDAAEGLWYSEFLCALLPRAVELGPRPIVLNSGVGGLPVEPPVLDAMAPGLALARHLGGAWGCQGYTLKYTKDAADVETWYSLRYRRAYAYFREKHPELADLPMILLEGGVDEIGDENKSGWQARGTLEKYTDWLAWYDGELRKDDQVLGVTLFKIGSPTTWKSFDLEPVVPWLKQHYHDPAIVR